MTDASAFVWTPADADKEANANAAHYFRKADLLASAVPGTDGYWHVLPTAPQMYVLPDGATASPLYPAPTRSTTGPSTLPQRGQVIIIPKRLLDRPLKDFTDNKPLKVAAAR